MKKTLLLVLSSGFILSACKSQTTPAPQTQQQAADEFAMIADAIQAGKPIACTFTQSADASVMHYAMSGKKIKVTGIQAEGQNTAGSMISDGESLYTWDDIKKEGVKMTLPQEQDLRDFAKDNGTNIPDVSDESERQNWQDQGYMIDCAQATLTDADFLPPADVKFTDMSAMMDSIKTMMQSADPNEAMNANEQEMMQQKVQEMMDQYGDTNQ